MWLMNWLNTLLLMDHTILLGGNGIGNDDDGSFSPRRLTQKFSEKHVKKV